MRSDSHVLHLSLTLQIAEMTRVAGGLTLLERSVGDKSPRFHRYSDPVVDARRSAGLRR